MTGPGKGQSADIARRRPSERLRPMTVASMRAAVIAIRAGAFDHDSVAGDACCSIRTDRQAHAWLRLAFGGPAVVVLAGHAGAGSSTVALALAESLSKTRTVELVEYCAPALSGLVAASTRELGADAGWRLGRRGGLVLARPAETDPPPRLPRCQADTDDRGRDQVVVLDFGWSAAVASVHAGRPGKLFDPASTVVVTRVTVPGVRQAESVLAAVGDAAIVAAVGGRRWPCAVAASCGPAMQRSRDMGRVVAVPLDRRLATAGLTPDPLPRPLRAAGRALAGLLLPDRAEGRLRSPSPSRAVDESAVAR